MMAAPKLRPLTEEKDIKAIPIDQPVLIQLPAAVSNAEPDGTTPPKPAETQRTEPSPEAKALQAQLDAMREANRQRDVREAQLARERDEAREQARQANQQRGDAEQQHATSGLAKAQSDSAAAKQAYRIASEAGDFAAAADAQERLARAAADIRHFEGVAAEIGQRKTERQEIREQPRNQEQTDMMAAMRASPNLLPAEKTWFEAHPEALLDGRMNRRLEVAYEKAMEKGLSRGSTAYTQFIDQEMGYRQPERQEAEEGNEDPAMPAAPVTRGNGSMNTQRTDQVILTAEERDLCSQMGISEVAYAQGKVAMAQDKKANPEKYFMQR